MYKHCKIAYDTPVLETRPLGLQLSYFPSNLKLKYFIVLRWATLVYIFPFEI